MGYGDFTLISSDGIHFHIDRSLLAYLSGFFRDLFALPSPGSSYTGIVGENSVAVQQPSNTLNAFLRHIDPNKVKPEINKSNIASILECARFYRVPTIMTWFTQEVQVRRTMFRRKEQEPCFMEKNPLFVLSLAYQLGLRDLTEIAMSALITCEIAQWDIDAELPMDSRLILYCRKLRDERIYMYSDLVESLTEHEISNAKNIKDATRETCMSCTVARAQWTHKMMSTAIRHPEWSAFVEAYEEDIEPHDCDHDISWPTIKRKPFTKWCNIHRPEQLEHRPPAIPAWLDQQLQVNALLTP